MADASQFYWTQDLLRGFGDMWFLRSPQQTGIVGGGDKLLGSVLPRLQDTGFLSFNHYPAPSDFMESQYVLNKMLELQNAGKLNISGSLIQSQNFATGTSVDSKTQGLQLAADSGQIPGVPVVIGVSLDYSSVDTFNVTLGDGTRAAYIPLDFLARLYAFCGGNSKVISPGQDIADEYICDSVLGASNYTVSVTAKSSLSTSLKASLSKLPPSGSVTLTDSTDSSFTLQIAGKEYMIALGTRRWDDLG